jgi:hypothetical protein
MPGAPCFGFQKRGNPVLPLSYVAFGLQALIRDPRDISNSIIILKLVNNKPRRTANWKLEKLIEAAVGSAVGGIRNEQPEG